MRVHRVFVSELAKGEVVLVGEEAGHLSRVLRVTPGARVRAFNGRGLEAQGVVTSVDEARVGLTLTQPHASEVEASLTITLAVALLKGDKLTEVVRRGTELGVTAFQPLMTERCDVPDLSKNKLIRLRRVAQEAAKQSGRSVVPNVAEAIHVSALEVAGCCLVAQPHASKTLRDLAPQLETQPEALTCVTGPEGGLSEREVAALCQRGAHAVRLGARILRAETAPLALVAALLVPEAL